MERVSSGTCREGTEYMKKTHAPGAAAMSPAKEEGRRLLELLPDNVSLEDIGRPADRAAMTRAPVIWGLRRPLTLASYPPSLAPVPRAGRLGIARPPLEGDRAEGCLVGALRAATEGHASERGRPSG
jgi:hypothetical protein